MHSAIGNTASDPALHTGPNQAWASALGCEWVTLQNNYEQHEKSALTLKLSALFLAVAAAGFGLPMLLACVLVLVLWLQEGIVRTLQDRLGQRLLQLESLIRLDPPADADRPAAFQLHSQWLATRKSGKGLVVEYLRNALRPTVAR